MAALLVGETILRCPGGSERAEQAAMDGRRVIVAYSGCSVVNDSLQVSHRNVESSVQIDGIGLIAFMLQSAVGLTRSWRHTPIPEIQRLTLKSHAGYHERRHDGVKTDGEFSRKWGKSGGKLEPT